MDPHVFFSFHYRRDIWRANQVRQSWRIRSADEPDGRFVDASLWEETKLRGDDAVKALIDEGLDRTNASVVLIGHDTWKRRWVRYEIDESWRRDNALLGIHIHKLRDRNGTKDRKGKNPFDYVSTEDGTPLSEFVPVYDWVDNGGYENLGDWLDDAPRASELEGIGLGTVLAWGAGLAIGASLIKGMIQSRRPPGYL